MINQFFLPLTNKRTDKYGGDVKKQARSLLEILKRVREKVGEGYPVLCRINGDDCIEGGIKSEEAKIIAKVLEDGGVDALENL